MNDKISIECTKYDKDTPDHQREHSIVYMVSKFGYDNCLLDDAKPVGRCDNKSVRPVIFTIRQLTPVPGGLEFIPGTSYFFITVSDGTLGGNFNTENGLCLTKNMKLRLDIAPVSYRPLQQSSLASSKSFRKLPTASPNLRQVHIPSVGNFLWHAGIPSQMQTLEPGYPESNVKQFSGQNGIQRIDTNAYLISEQYQSDTGNHDDVISPKFSRNSIRAKELTPYRSTQELNFYSTSSNSTPSLILILLTIIAISLL